MSERTSARGGWDPRVLGYLCFLGIAGAAAACGTGASHHEDDAFGAVNGTAGVSGSASGSDSGSGSGSGSGSVSGSISGSGSSGRSETGGKGATSTSGRTATSSSSGGQNAQAGRDAGSASDGADDDLIGWASVAGDGDPTTTGGEGGETVTPKTADELLAYAKSSDPLIIQISSNLSVPRLEVASNKTLIGAAGGATIAGGVRIRGKGTDEFVHNVIFKNLRVNAATSDVDGDGVQIHFAHHVWIDHCEIWDAPDGNLDIVHASNWVTVSYTKFHYTDAAPAKDHRFSNLVGHSDDNADEDTDRLKITFHHDLWADGVIERMPRVRFGQVHVFNNQYTAKGNNYAIGAGLEARLLIENNSFEGVADPHIFYDGEPTAQIVAQGNAYTNTTGEKQSGQGSAFKPPYPYTPDAADAVGAKVQANVGPQ